MTIDPGTRPSATEIRTTMRAALTAAMKGRDRVAASALRSGLGAIDNAEAVPGHPTTITDDGSPIAGAVVGVGATESPRRGLTRDDVHTVLRGEIDERRAAATEVEGAGRPDRAETLRREADILEAALAGRDGTIAG